MWNLKHSTKTLPAVAQKHCTMDCIAICAIRNLLFNMCTSKMSLRHLPVSVTHSAQQKSHIDSHSNLSAVLNLQFQASPPDSLQKPQNQLCIKRQTPEDSFKSTRHNNLIYSIHTIKGSVLCMKKAFLITVIYEKKRIVVTRQI